MSLKNATLAELDQLVDFYGLVIDRLDQDHIQLGWSRGGYPSAEFLREAISKKECYIALWNTKIVGAFILNHEANEGYQTVQWRIKAPREQIFILHTFATAPAYRGQGLAKEILQQILAVCNRKAAKVLRLDVVTGNAPASRLYCGMGFQLIDTIELTYGNMKKEFELYEREVAIF